MYIDWKRCRCPLPGKGSGNEIEWIWHLEYALGVAAAEIAILISDVGDNGKTRILDFLAAGRLEFLTRRFVVGGCYRRSLEAIARREKPIANQPVERA